MGSGRMIYRLLGGDILFEHHEVDGALEHKLSSMVIASGLCVVQDIATHLAHGHPFCYYIAIPCSFELRYLVKKSFTLCRNRESSSQLSSVLGSPLL